MSAPPILLIEDTPSLRLVYESVLKNAGHTVKSEGSAESGLAAFRTLQPPVVLLDLILPDRDGLDLMDDILTLRPETAVIVVTANDTVQHAVECIRRGANDFLTKPFDVDQLEGVVKHALESAQVVGRRSEMVVADPDLLVGDSPAMRRLKQRIALVAAPTETPRITEAPAPAPRSALKIYKEDLR